MNGLNALTPYRVLIAVTTWLLTFGLHGRIERVTAKVFLLSPHNVSVTAQDKARIENGFFNQS